VRDEIGNETPTTGRRFHLKKDFHFFEVFTIKSVGDKEGILDTILATLFLN
jgi:hypothetical protein